MLCLDVLSMDYVSRYIGVLSVDYVSRYIGVLSVDSVSRCAVYGLCV